MRATMPRTQAASGEIFANYPVVGIALTWEEWGVDSAAMCCSTALSRPPRATPCEWLSCVITAQHKTAPPRFFAPE